VLRKFRGWKTALGGARTWDDIPREAKEYVAFIEEFAEAPVGIVSVGYERNQTLVRESPWTRS